MSSALRSVLLLCAAASFAVSTDSEAATYQYTDLGRPGLATRAEDINNAGQIVGYGYNDPVIPPSGPAVRAIQWNSTTATDLATLPNRPFSRAFSINDAGQIVGQAGDAGNSLGNLAVVWNASITPTSLGRVGSATANNDAGQIVGSLYVNRPGNHAVLWNGSQTIDLTTSSGFDFGDARGINNAGQIVGNASSTPYSAPFAMSWSGATATVLGPGQANAINEVGQIVGASGGHAVVWNGGIATVLDPGRSGSANDINESGQIVGTSGGRGFLWDGGSVIDLSGFLDASTVAAGWVLTEANAINDSGWIVGTARNNLTNQTSAYVLSVVPEPQAVVLMSLGVGVIAFARRCRRGRAGRSSR